MIIFFVICSLYILHIFICRFLYIKIINIDKYYEFPTIAITWFVPIAGIFIHLIVFFITYESSCRPKGSWFIPKSKKK